MDGGHVPESIRVEDYRLSVLIEAGYPFDDANAMSRRSDVDLHQAVDLVKAGCPPETAARILL